MEIIGIGKKIKENISEKKNALKILKLLRTVFMFIFSGILIFIILASCIIMVNASTHPGKVPSLFGYKAMAVVTGSMEPKIKPGDLIIVKNIKDLDSIEVGAIITYKNNDNTLITHRVLEIDNQNELKTYTLKGDANPVPDVNPVSENQIQGIYSARIPYFGYVGMFVKTGTGMILLAITCMLFIFGKDIINYFKKFKVKSA